MSIADLAGGGGTEVGDVTRGLVGGRSDEWRRVGGRREPRGLCLRARSFILVILFPLFPFLPPPPVFMSFPLCDHSHPNRPFLSLLLPPGGAQRAFGNTAAAAASVGRITQVIGAVVDVQVRTEAFLRGVGGLHPFII